MTDRPSGEGKVAPPGHNLPPSAFLSFEAEQAIERALRVCEAAEESEPRLHILSEHHAGQAVLLVAQVNAAAKAIEDAYGPAMKPHQAALDSLRKTRDASLERLVIAKQRLLDKLGSWMREHDAAEVRSEYDNLASFTERDALAIDMETVDLEALRPYLNPTEVRRAARKALRTRQSIDGVTVVPVKQLVVR